MSRRSFLSAVDGVTKSAGEFGTCSPGVLWRGLERVVFVPVPALEDVGTRVVAWVVNV